MAAPLMIAGAIAQGVGALTKAVGALGQKAEAKRQIKRQEEFGNFQRGMLESGYSDLISQARGLSTYQADITQFARAERQAEEAKRLASGARAAGEQTALDVAERNRANALAAARQGARSGTDVMTSALLGQELSGEQQQQIMQQGMQIRQQLQQQAENNLLYTLGQTAYGMARERGMEFESQRQKEMQELGLRGQKLQAGMGLEQQLFSQKQAQAAALANARAAILGGFGDVAQTVGSGLMGMAQQKQQMDVFERMYQNPSQVPAASSILARNIIGTGADLATQINPQFGQMTSLTPSR